MSDFQASFRFKLFAAFAAVYIIWGSTYLALRLLIDTLPGFVMVGLRFIIAGLILILWAIARRATPPTPGQILRACLVGVSLLTFGTGAVVWAAPFIPSGLLALVVSMEPLFVLLILWATPAGHRPNALTASAIALGFAGAAILVAPGDLLNDQHLPLVPVLVICFGCFSWAAGSIYSRGADMPVSGPWSSGLQMLGGGLLLTIFGGARGELTAFDPAKVSMTSILAFLYLVIFGSLIAFTAFAWLVRNADPNMVATHTFVNPVVAVFLGWLLANEPVGPRTLIAASLIIFSVVLTTLGARAEQRQSKEELPHACAAEA